MKKIPFILLLILLAPMASTVCMAEGKIHLSGQMFDKFSERVTFKELDFFLAQEHFSLEVAINALQDFAKGNLQNFDPPTGDANCQIRAHQIIQLVKNPKLVNEEVPYLITALTALREKIKVLKRESKDPGHRERIKNSFNRAGKPEELLMSMGLNYPHISQDGLQIILSHFLTSSQSDNDTLMPLLRERLKNSFNDLNDLIAANQKTINAMDQLLDKAKKKISLCTDIHLQTIIDSVYQGACGENANYPIPEGQKNSLGNLHVLLQQVETFGLYRSRSTYAGLYYLMADLWNKDVPIVFKTTVICPQHGLHKMDIVRMKGNLPFNFISFEGDLKAFAERPMVVMEGVSDLTGNYGNQASGQLMKNLEKILQEKKDFYPVENCPLTIDLKSKIKNLGVDLILKANSSRHQQFVDKSKEIDFSVLGAPRSEEAKEDFDQHCNKAIGLGLCMENMSTFRLIHIFPSKASEAMGKVKTEKDRELRRNLENAENRGIAKPR